MSEQPSLSRPSDPDGTVAFPDTGLPATAGVSALEALGAIRAELSRVQLRDPEAWPGPAAAVAGKEPAGVSDPSGRYLLSGEIARGGMGAVLMGRDVDLGRDIAVKVLLEAHQGKPEFLRRFVEEAQIAGQLQHPGVVPVYELGTFPDRRPYFTMKLVKGQTLARLLAARADPAEGRPRFLKIFEQICQTLGYAHARGVVHRDLKPGNVMVGNFGEVQVMDWGLAKVLPREGEAGPGGATGEPPGSAIRTVPGPGAPAEGAAQTNAGSVLGTPAYMPPEQALGEVERLDARCDVFGLGAILCEILTGRPPYAGGNSEQVWRRAARADLAEAFARLDGCGADRELINLTQHCLAPEPEGRPPDAGVVAAALTAYRESVEARLRQAELRRAAADARAEGERKRRRLTLALAASVLGTLVLGGGGWLWVERDRAERQAAEARLREDRDRVERDAAEARLRRQRDDAERLAAEAQSRRQRERRVSAALERVAALREKAKARPAEARSLLAEARAAAERAEGLLGHGPADTDFRQRVHKLVTELREEERDRRMLARLEEVRLSGAAVRDKGFDTRAVLAAYVTAFKEYGIDLRGQPPAKAGAQLRARAIRTELAAALVDWAVLSMQVIEARQSVQLYAVARAADPDPARLRLWDAMGERDLPALTKMAAADSGPRLPSSTVVLLAKMLAGEGATAEAVSLLRRARRHHPDSFWIHHELGDLLLLHVRPSQAAEAIQSYSLAVALRPQSPGAYLNLGHALMRPRSMPEAEVAFRKAIALKPDYASAYMNLGLTLALQGQYDKALSAGRRAIELEPKSAQVYAALGHALKGKGLLDEAIAAYEKALTLNPKLPVAHWGLGRVWKKKGRTDDAIASYRQALALGLPVPEAAYDLGCLLQQRGKADEAINAYRQATELDPSHVKAHAALGILLVTKRRWDDAIATYRRAILLEPKDATLHSNLGLALLEKGELKEAADALVNALALQPDLAPCHYNLGVVFQQKGQVEEALLKYRTALRLDPKYPEANCNLGRILEDRGEFQEARAAIERGHELGRKNPDWRYPSAKWLRRAELLARLDRELSAILKGKALPGGEEGRTLILFCHLRKRFYGHAARLWERAFAAAPALAEDLKAGYRYNAACAAALAGCGRGADAVGFDERDRARWREQARAWLRADLGALTKLAAGGKPADLEFVRGQREHWQKDPDLAGLRDKQALARLPAAEQDTCRRLWADVGALLAKPAEKK